MRPRDRSLLDQIEHDALDRNAPLADTLRKVVALGGKVGSTELREWASRELRGYLGVHDDDLPDYRKLGAMIMIDGVTINLRITGQQISPRSFPERIRDLIREEIQLREGIGEIEAMVERARADGGAVRFTLPDAQTLARLIEHEAGQPYQHITAIYWMVGETPLQGVVDQVRTTLVELVAEMVAGTPEDVELPSQEVANQAVNVVIHGGEPRINLNTPQTSGSGSHRVHASQEGSRTTFWVVLSSLAGVAAVLVGIATWQGWWT